jgi:hypothetical protein
MCSLRSHGSDVAERAAPDDCWIPAVSATYSGSVDKIWPSTYVWLDLLSAPSSERACAAAPAAEPVFIPSIAFKLGDAAGTKCPAAAANMVTITSAAACQSAAAAAGNPYGGNMMALYVPGGCHWLTVSGTFYFNEEATGGGNDLARPVCAGAPELDRFKAKPFHVNLGGLFLSACLVGCLFVRYQ